MLTTYTVLLATLLPIALSSPVPAPQRIPTAAADSNVSAESELETSLSMSNTSTVQPEAVQDTANKAGCSDMILVFARGTTELAPIGSLTGPPFVNALQKEIGGASLDVQGVPYPADIPGFLVGGSPSGSKTMADMISTAVSSCPDSKVVMSGYSQGGQLVHNAAKLLPASTMAKVSSVVIFGDPDDGEDVVGVAAAQTKVICHAGDNICDGGALVLAPHLTYSIDAPAAAKFVAASAGINSK